jgi:RNA polymerase sigma factor (sigma-70 family)
MNSLHPGTANAHAFDIDARVKPNDDQLRFSSVVLPHLDDAYALARCLTGSRTDSEDVVQEACLRAFRGIRGFSNGDARAWVLRIVRNMAYDWLHKNRPASLLLVDDLEDLERAHLIEQNDATPETTIAVKQEKTALEAAIAVLSPQYRETLVLRELRGLTYREISDLMGTSIGTVMSRLFRARRHLIGILADNRVRRTCNS